MPNEISLNIYFSFILVCMRLVRWVPQLVRIPHEFLRTGSKKTREPVPKSSMNYVTMP